MRCQRWLGAPILALLLSACAASAQTSYPSAYDSTANLPTVHAGDVIKSAESNTQNTALFALEHAIGIPTPGVSIETQLGQKANTSDLQNLNPKVFSSTLNAAAYAGSDIGAKVNAAVADCNNFFSNTSCTAAGVPNLCCTGAGTGTCVGALAWCHITIPPGVYSQTTPITISRALTTLDCQGAILVAASSFTDVPIRLNYATVGVQAAPVGDIGLRNCIINSASQSSMSTEASDTGDNGAPRIGSVVAWNITGLDIDNVIVVSSFGPGLTVLQSQGSVSRVTVTTTRAGIGGNAAGMHVTGTGYGGGTAGMPVYVTSSHVDTSATYGIWAQVGVVLRDIDISGTQSACVALGGGIALGGGVTQGWVTLDGFTLERCALGTIGSTGAIDSATANTSNPLQYVVIKNGRIRNVQGNGISLPATASLFTTITNNQLECVGLNGFGADGVLIIPAGTVGTEQSGIVISDNTITNLLSCAAGTLNGIHLLSLGGGWGGNVERNLIDGQTYGIHLSGAFTGLIVKDNAIRDTTDASIFSDAPVPGDSGLTDVAIRDNTLGGCTANATSGQITLIDNGNGAAYNQLLITGNHEETGNGNNVSAVLTTFGGTVSAVNAILTGNFFPDAGGTNDFPEINQTGAHSITFTRGEAQIGNFYGSRAPVMMNLFNSSGALIPAGHLVCYTGIECTTANPARFAVGFAVRAIQNGTFGDVVVSGASLISAPCTGSIVAGDLLVNSTATNGSVMTNNSAAAGEVRGRAKTPCSAGLVVLLPGS